MGSGAGALRQGMGLYDSIERHLRLERPNRPYHHHIIVISVSRIPPVELEEADAMMMGTSSTSSDDDYDYEPSEGADIRYRW